MLVISPQLTNPTERIVQGFDEDVSNLRHEVSETPESIRLRKLCNGDDMKMEEWGITAIILVCDYPSKIALLDICDVPDIPYNFITSSNKNYYRKLKTKQEN